MERRRVVITGLGAVTPIGLTAGESWQAVKCGVCGIGPITHYDPAAQKVKLAAEVKGFDPEALLGRQESKRMGRFTQFAVAAAREALSDAGFSVEQADADRCGVILSSGIGGQAITEAEHSRGMEKGFDRVSPFYVPTAICNMAAGQVAIDAGFRAMCSCPVTACAGGTNAVGDAFHYIRDGYAEVMLCGGTEASITPMSIGGFTSMKALTQTEDPNRASIPFDAERSGFVMGEGAGVLLLEELEHAKTRGAKIYAEVVGYGATCDAHHITAPLADGSGGAKAMAMALADGRRFSGAGGLHQRPRHLYPPQRCRGDRRGKNRVRPSRLSAGYELHQVHDRTYAGSRRRRGSHLHRPEPAGRLLPRHHPLSDPGPGLRSGCGAQRGPSGGHPVRPEQLSWLRRTQRQPAAEEMGGLTWACS